MPYNFVADSIYTKKLCSKLSSSEVQFQTENGRFAFLSLRFVTIKSFDRQTDGQTEKPWHYGALHYYAVAR